MPLLTEFPFVKNTRDTHLAERYVDERSACGTIPPKERGKEKGRPSGDKGLV